MRLTLTIPVELEVTVEVDYEPGRKARGPSYDCGGEPPEPEECEITGICYDGRELVLSDADLDALADAVIELAAAEYAARTTPDPDRDSDR